jgi:hypothetical protein
MNKIDLNLPQLYSLYSNGMRIDQSVIQEILELPRQALIEDLEAIVKASIDHFEFYKEKKLSEVKRCFPVHAFFLLTELKSDNSLYIALAFLSQPKEFLSFWCGKYTKEVLWEVIYTLGNNSLEFLKKFLLSGMNSIEANKVILKAVSQIALHQPERRDEIVNWYKGILHYIIQSSYRDYHYSYSLAGTVVSGILDFQGVELFNEVRILFDMNRVNKSICGDIDDFTTELRTEMQRDFKSKIYDIYERYDFILTDREYYSKMEDIKEVHNNLRNGLIKS